MTLLTFLSRLWEGSWADDAITADVENDAYADPDKIRTIHHHGKYFGLDTKHIVDPSPQRTPFLFQAGTSTAGSAASRLLIMLSCRGPLSVVNVEASLEVAELISI